MHYTFLNTSILTDYGSFTYRPTTLGELTTLLDTPGNTWESAIGHASTAEILSSLFDMHIKMNRVEYRQKLGEVAIVFKLPGRPAEGKVLTREEIEQIGYSFGLLERVQ